jgi:hypothetical protein
MHLPQLPLARASSSSETPHGDPGDLEASLLLLRDTAQRRAMRNAGRVSDLLVDAVNSGVQGAVINEKRIELEIRALTETIARFMK